MGSRESVITSGQSCGSAQAIASVDVVKMILESYLSLTLLSDTVKLLVIQRLSRTLAIGALIYFGWALSDSTNGAVTCSLWLNRG